METKIVKLECGDGILSPEDKAALKEAGEVLKKGGLVAFPTETVYGLGGDALNKASSQKK